MRSIISANTPYKATSITTSLVLPVHVHITYETIVEDTMVIKYLTLDLNMNQLRVPKSLS